jgi:hypothetical protein
MVIAVPVSGRQAHFEAISQGSLLQSIIRPD